MVEASTYYAQEREVTENKKQKIVGNPEWKTSLGRPKYIQENNTQIHVLIKKNRTCGCGVLSTKDRIQF